MAHQWQSQPSIFAYLRPSVQGLSSLPFVRLGLTLPNPQPTLTKLPGSSFEQKAAKGSKGSLDTEWVIGGKANPLSLLTLRPSVPSLSSLPVVRLASPFQTSAGLKQLQGSSERVRPASPRYRR